MHRFKFYLIVEKKTSQTYSYSECILSVTTISNRTSSANLITSLLLLYIRGMRNLQSSNLRMKLRVDKSVRM